MRILSSQDTLLAAPGLLFNRIPPEREQEWRELFGSDKMKNVKEEEAARKAAKKAAKKTAKTVVDSLGWMSENARYGSDDAVNI